MEALEARQPDAAELIVLMRDFYAKLGKPFHEVRAVALHDRDLMTKWLPLRRGAELA